MDKTDDALDIMDTLMSDEEYEKATFWPDKDVYDWMDERGYIYEDMEWVKINE